jgi:hypothetical protein
LILCVAASALPPEEIGSEGIYTGEGCSTFWIYFPVFLALIMAIFVRFSGFLDE